MKKKIVIPGDFVGTEEEYIGGPGIYSENEKLYVSVPGELEDTSREVRVNRNVSLGKLDVGLVVVGTVENIVEPIALIRILTGSEKGKRFSESPDFAVIHASSIKNGYVKNVRDEFKIGDIVRAKIVEIRNGELRLSTDGEELGAIMAFCKSCRHAMKNEHGVLSCELCGKKDNRHIANDYRKVNIG